MAGKEDKKRETRRGLLLFTLVAAVRVGLKRREITARKSATAHRSCKRRGLDFCANSLIAILRAQRV
jgi:hypothetical protein